MKLNIIASIVLAAAMFVPAGAQNFKDGEALIPLAVVPMEQDAVPASAQTAFRDKLMQLIANNGLGSSNSNTRFVLTASILEQSKDFVAGPPKQVSALFDITFYILDNADHKIFSSTTVPARSIDYSMEKALLRAIRGVKVNSPSIDQFVTKGKQKIVNYYNDQCDNIILKAKSLASERKYAEAFFELTCIPEACGIAYRRAIVAGTEIFQSYVDYQGEMLLAKAKAIWASDQHSAGAFAAGEYLCQIDPSAACRPEAEKLYQEIKAKVHEDWKFEMKIYQDSVDIEKQKIAAWRDVGVAFGEHQQRQDNHVAWVLH